MVLRNALNFQQSPLGGMLPEYWKLVPDRAVTLCPDGAGVLEVSQGRVWVTTQGPHQGPANDWGDRVLRRGEQLHLAPGQQVVLEAYGEAVNEAAFFHWEPAGAAPSRAPAVGWLRWLRLGAARAGELLLWLVPGRGRVLSALESNQP
ncbi:MAG: DUF2917 domain-containing protein [Rhodoferax sp.]|jgi:hypothetical protein|nr:DUF2917 domain-containing protein [Rhodoferax sp.]